MIHTFGDSHACKHHSGWGGCDGVVTHHIGPVLCYSFGVEKLKRCNISNYNLQDGDSVVFCFGEIDCRNHVHKHITENNGYKTIITKLVDNYISAIQKNLKHCNVNIKNVSIYNVIPPIHWRYEAPDHPFPYLGSDQERKTYVKYFNQLLRDKCKDFNYIYFDIYDNIADSDGFLKIELSDDNCHLKDSIHIQNFIKEHFNN